MIYAILQDSQGYLWFGTKRGLNRFDGLETTEFLGQHRESHNKDLHVADLHEDRDQYLWVATKFGLYQLSPGRDVLAQYTPVEGDETSLSDHRLNCLYEDPSGTLWIGSGTLWIGTGTGLNEFDKSTGTSRRHLHDPDDPIQSEAIM